MTCSAPLWEGLTAMNECQLHPRTLAGPCCCRCPETTARCLPTPEKFARLCNSSVSGIMENHSTHLAPGITLNDLVPAPVNVGIFWGLLGPRGLNSLYQMPFQQWNRFSPCGLRPSRTPVCSWGFALPTRALPGIELLSCSLCAPLVYSLNGI